MADFHKPLLVAAHVVIVVGIGFTLASAWIFFWTAPEPPPAAVRAEAPAAARRDVPLQQLTSLDLFGKPVIPNTPGAMTAQEATEDLRETRLSLDLVGVVVADEPHASIAYIGQKGRSAESFAVGDMLPGNARLAEVYWDRVVISRGGIRELLRFGAADAEDAEDSEAGGIQRNEPGRKRPRKRRVRREAGPRPGLEPEMAAPARPAVPGSRPSPQALARFDARLRDDRAAALGELGLRPEDADGGVYVVDALADRSELQGILKRGDRIVSLNGRSLGDPDLKLAQAVAQGPVRLEIQRGERRFVITAPLN